MSEMCKAMEELRVESRKEMAVEMAQSLYEQGVSIEQIAKASKVDADTVKDGSHRRLGNSRTIRHQRIVLREHGTLAFLLEEIALFSFCW